MLDCLRRLGAPPPPPSPPPPPPPRAQPLYHVPHARFGCDALLAACSGGDAATSASTFSSFHQTGFAGHDFAGQEQYVADPAEARGSVVGPAYGIERAAALHRLLGRVSNALTASPLALARASPPAEVICGMDPYGLGVPVAARSQELLLWRGKEDGAALVADIAAGVRRVAKAAA